EARKWCDLALAWLDRHPADGLFLELAIEMVSEQLAQEPRSAALHLHRARLHAKRLRRPEALADFTRALELDPTLEPQPEDLRLLYWRGAAAARRGEWRKASADFAQVVRFPGARAGAWYAHALVLLYLGDTAGYKKACAAMWQRFGQTEDRDTIEFLAWTCVL